MEFAAIPSDICVLMMDFISTPPKYTKKQMNDHIIETSNSIGTINASNKKKKILVMQELYYYIADNHALFRINRPDFSELILYNLDLLAPMKLCWIPRIKKRLELDIAYREIDLL